MHVTSRSRTHGHVRDASVASFNLSSTLPALRERETENID